MSDYISASPGFRESVLALLLFTDWVQRYGTIIQPEYFPSKDEQNLVEWVNWYYSEYNTLPSDSDLDNEFGENELLDNVYAVQDDRMDHTADVAMDFARVQAMKIAVLDCVDDINDGHLERIMPRIQTAMAVGTDSLSFGYDFIDDVNDWMYDEVHGKRYPTGWTTVDAILEGGLVGGEYGLIMAPTGRGKSMALVNIGFAMAGILAAANVLHITYEMPASKVLKRYAIRATGFAVPRGSGQKEYIKKLKEQANAKIRAKVRVVKPEDRTVDGIRRIINGLAFQGFEVEALIADYPDIMTPTRTRKEKRFELGDITRELRQVGEDFNIPVWGATQAGRQALYKEVITVSDISEAIDKANVSDIIIAMCQTRDEEKMKQGRLFLAKVRDSESGIIVPMNLDLARCFIQQRGKLSV